MKEKEIYTGCYLFGDINSNQTCGGVSGRIQGPLYTKKIMLFINARYKHVYEKIYKANVYSFSIAELENLHKTLERILNDMRKLEELSKRNLLSDEAYRFIDKSTDW